MENQSRKRSQRLDGIGVGRIRTFPFIPLTTPSLTIQWKNFIVGVWSRNERFNQSQGPETNIVIGSFNSLCFRLRQSSFHRIVSVGVISGCSVLLLTPSVWFSTRSYRSTLPITTLTPSLVKTSLKNTLQLHMQRQRSIPNRNTTKLISRRCPRFVNTTELGHFTLLFCRGRQRMYKDL